jgi:hypothetical protein
MLQRSAIHGGAIVPVMNVPKYVVKVFCCIFVLDTALIESPKKQTNESSHGVHILHT